MEERWDFVEVEAKVVPQKPYSRLVELAQEAAPPGFKMVRKPHVAFYDLYLDSPGLGLARNEAYLRVRFDRRSLQKKGKYKVFYKDNNPPGEGTRYLSRREVRTDLKRREILAYGARLHGTAAELAYAVLGRAGEPAALQPVCVVSSFRRYFTMHSEDPTKTDCLNLSIEHSTAFRTSDLDVVRLLETGVIDAPLSSHVYDFDICEAELTVEGNADADAMFQRLVVALDKECGLVTGSKYLACLEQLGIHPRKSA